MKETIRRQVWEYTQVTFCGFLLALNYVLFILPNQFAPSGINGVATMIQYVSGFSIGYMNLLINIPLCLIAVLFVSRDFAIKSFVFTGVYSLSYLLLEKADLSRFAYHADGVDTILPVIVAGAIMGVLTGATFRVGGSTAGTDILGKLISVKAPRFNFFWVTFVLNAVVAVFSYFVYTTPGPDGAPIYSFKPVVLCLIYCLMSSEVGDAMIRGGQSAIKFEIVTMHPDEIAAAILNELHRGVTELHAHGMYSGEERALLMCVISKHELPDLERILRGYSDTFAYMSPVNKVMGYFPGHPGRPPKC